VCRPREGSAGSGAASALPTTRTIRSASCLSFSLVVQSRSIAQEFITTRSSTEMLLLLVVVVLLMMMMLLMLPNE